MGCLWALAAAALYWLKSRYRTGAAVVGLVVLSHWFLDAFSHTPDMPLYPGPSPRVGLGLWNSLAGTVIVEGLMFAAAVWLYATATRARNRGGSYGLWLFVAVMVGLYIANIFGPPPPDFSAVAWVGIAFVVFFFWAHGFDRQRDVIAGAPHP
jgi:FtsH-binding integral membrane protein